MDTLKTISSPYTGLLKWDVLLAPPSRKAWPLRPSEHMPIREGLETPSPCPWVAYTPCENRSPALKFTPPGLSVPLPLSDDSISWTFLHVCWGLGHSLFLESNFCCHSGGLQHPRGRSHPHCGLLEPDCLSSNTCTLYPTHGPLPWPRARLRHLQPLCLKSWHI